MSQDNKNDKALILRTIDEAVAHFFGMTINELHQRRRSRAVVVPRQIATYLMKQVFGVSLAQIGRHFGGQNRATVRHSVSKVEVSRHTAIEVELSLCELIQSVERAIRPLDSPKSETGSLLFLNSRQRDVTDSAVPNGKKGRRGDWENTCQAELALYGIGKPFLIPMCAPPRRRKNAEVPLAPEHRINRNLCTPLASASRHRPPGAISQETANDGVLLDGLLPRDHTTELRHRVVDAGPDCVLVSDLLPEVMSVCFQAPSGVAFKLSGLFAARPRPRSAMDV
jgi:hypothetical protein